MMLGRAIEATKWLWLCISIMMLGVEGMESNSSYELHSFGAFEFWWSPTLYKRDVWGVVTPTRSIAAGMGLVVNLENNPATVLASELVHVAEDVKASSEGAVPNGLHEISYPCGDPTLFIARCSLYVNTTAIELRSPFRAAAGFHFTEEVDAGAAEATRKTRRTQDEEIESEASEEVYVYRGDDSMTAQTELQDFVLSQVPHLTLMSTPLTDDYDISESKEFHDIYVYLWGEVNEMKVKRVNLVEMTRAYVTASSVNHGEILLAVGEVQSQVVPTATDTTPWLLMSYNLLDVTCAQAWQDIFGHPGLHQIRVIKAEHVLEHLSLAEAVVALRLMRRYLMPGGRIRLAVPDYNALLSGEWELPNSPAALGRAASHRVRDRRFDPDLPMTLPDGSNLDACTAPEAQVQCHRLGRLMQKGSLYQDITDGHRVRYSKEGVEALLRSVGFDTHMLEWTDSAGVVQGPCAGKGPGVFDCPEWSPREGEITRSSRGRKGKSVSLVVDGIVPNKGRQKEKAGATATQDIAVDIPPPPSKVILDLLPLERRTCVIDATSCEVLRGPLPLVVKHLSFHGVPLVVRTSNKVLVDAASQPPPTVSCGPFTDDECDGPGGTWGLSGLTPLTDEMQRMFRMFRDRITLELHEPASVEEAQRHVGVSYIPVADDGTEGKRVVMVWEGMGEPMATKDGAGNGEVKLKAEGVKSNTGAAEGRHNTDIKEKTETETETENENGNENEKEKEISKDGGEDRNYEGATEDTDTENFLIKVGFPGSTIRTGYRPNEFFFMRDRNDFVDAEEIRQALQGEVERVHGVQDEEDVALSLVTAMGADAPEDRPKRKKPRPLMIAIGRRSMDVPSRMDTLNLMVPAVAAYDNAFIVLVGGPPVVAEEHEVLTLVKWVHVREPTDVAVRRKIYWSASLVVMTAVGPAGGTVMTLCTLEASACGANTLILSSGGKVLLKDDPSLVDDVRKELLNARRKEKLLAKDDNLKKKYRPEPLIQRENKQAKEEREAADEDNADEMWLRDWQGWAPATDVLLEALGVTHADRM